MSTLQLVDVEHWPAVARTPYSPVRAAAARQILRWAVRELPVVVLLPDGRRLGAGGAGAPVMEIVSDSFFHRIGADLKIGFGESYMAGNWRAGRGTDLADLLSVFASRLSHLVPPVLQRFRKLIEQRMPSSEDNDRQGARANIARHYDLSNDLFATFLDSTMTYSSAWFSAPTDGFGELAEAQRRKIDGVLDFAAVRAGSRVLEIGTGWGQLAIQAAERGATITSVTLSAEQRDLARKRIADAGVNATVELRDYRDVQGQYDAVVSVEMIEAVGERYWPTYFATVDRLLAPGGRFGLQSITMPHDRLLATRHAQGWIHKYIFPGGLIPSLTAIDQIAATAGGLEVVERRDLRPDYAHTLWLWRDRFTSRAADVANLGFDAVFRRMWEFYLAYSEAGFRAGYLGVSQLALARKD
ncbi:cyclopropane-fatty-acyl-phospholipid synthase [Kribbella orskensis]|uniref:Cyclopropane-fatty-acyl-phospholipid synthase n=1 Tax=Kribbella orskensis TaxID=2512216 RepID=A0ABY2BSX2_9ACTN|nr:MULTISPECIES: cyclopropane-fatty-acyl-phospholipid synthase family protein [Kribbella]TCN42689.1 cyclopropane-fatty-acyl-phospholipid synthase [Kribbella sp. VKM Ac-2500]TCO29955.1 cyclopropane-fatty-acyl-phospholipid synthase [Kribbella orskensis]